MAESSMPKRSEDDCDMVTSLQEPFLSKAELALHEAARTGKRMEVDRLVRVKLVKVDCRNSLDRTPLHMAASKGHLDVVRLLLDNRASVEIGDKYGMSPLMWATYFGHQGVVQLLVDKSANVKRRNKLGMHVLHIAAENNHADLVKLFISKTKRTVLDDTEKNGQSAIMIAAAKANADVVDALIQLGADLKLRDVHKRTILHLSAESGSEEVLDKLLRSSNKISELVNEKDDRGWTPMHYAVEKGFAGAAEQLLAHGAFPEEEDEPKEAQPAAVWPPVKVH